MGGRPEHFPGELKTRPNQAGNTVFVAPELVEATLYRGYELYADLEGWSGRCSCTFSSLTYTR